MNDHEIRSQLEQHHTAAWGWSLQCTGGVREEAEDLLQSVYLKVLGGRARFEGRSTFRTWLFAVIRKTAIDAGRRKVLDRRKREELAGSIPPRPSTGSSDEVERRSHLQRSLRSLLEALSERQREVLHLVFYQGMTVEEASVAMGVSAGAARKHYDRGKKMMKQLIEKERHRDE